MYSETQRDAILAGLRLLQRAGPATAGSDIHDIATNCGTHEPLDDDGIDALCDQINTGPADGELSRDWLVQWETNAFDVDTPEEAAMQAWCQMRQRDHVPVFTVRDPEGAVHTVDMGG